MLKVNRKLAGLTRKLHTGVPERLSEARCGVDEGAGAQQWPEHAWTNVEPSNKRAMLTPNAYAMEDQLTGTKRHVVARAHGVPPGSTSARASMPCGGRGGARAARVVVARSFGVGLRWTLLIRRDTWLLSAWADWRWARKSPSELAKSRARNDSVYEPGSDLVNRGQLTLVGTGSMSEENVFLSRVRGSQLLSHRQRNEPTFRR